MKATKMTLKWGRKFTLLLAFAAFAAVIYPTFATDWYVDDVNGDDAYAGTSAALAKKTIQAAVDLVGNGDTVYVAPGRYNTGSMA